MTEAILHRDARILVIGSSGFVGSAIARAALAQGHRVSGIARSGRGPVQCLTTSFELCALREAVETFRPEVLVHAAGLPSVAATEADPQASIASTVEPFRRVVAAMEASGLACSLLYISSAAVYGNPTRLPVREDAPLAPISVYGRHRIVCEALAADLAQRLGLTAVAIRAFSLFGASQRRLIVWELFNRISQSNVVTIAGTGHEVRDFLDVDAFAQCVLRLAGVKAPGLTPVNVASGVGTTIRGLAELILDVMDLDKPIVCEGAQFPNDPLHWQADVSRYRALTGSDMGHDLRRGIERAVGAWQ